MSTIRVGVAGWDYADWQGPVYPARTSRGFDRLAFLAGFVDVIEVNTSFYHAPDPAVCASWVRRVTGTPLVFTAKAHRSCTHEELDPDAALAPTLEGLAPLREAGLLRAVLLQFPQRFHDTPPARQRLQRLLDPLRNWSPVVEFRHASWDTDDALAWLERHGAGWCVVDQPQVGRSTIAARERISSAVGYLRLHGRNAGNWFREDAGRDARYDYLYDTSQLEPLAATARRLGEQAEEVFVVQNNHFRGQALVNAAQMKHLIDGSRPTVPDPLARAYPQLRAVARIRQPDLF